MQTQEENPLEKNDLLEAIKKLREKIQSGEFLNIRFVALLAILGAVIGVWLYLRATGQRSEASYWDSFNTLNSADAFDKMANEAGKTSLGHNRLARLQQARYLLAEEGMQQLTSLNPDNRKKGIQSVEKARELFGKLAEELKDDVTLKGQCLDGLARAELALVGIPKEGDSTASRGDVKKAVQIYQQYATLVGEKSTVGEQLLKTAKELETLELDLNTLGRSLDGKYSPKPIVEEPKLPSGLAPGTTPSATSPIIPPPNVVTPPTTPMVPTPAKKEPETKSAPSIPPPVETPKSK